MQGLVILPEDVQLLSVVDLPPQIRAQLAGEDGDFALTRPLSRTPSKVIDANAAALLQRFRKPMTIVDAILGYSREVNAPPQQVLEEAYPLIESCLTARFLVEPGAKSEKVVAAVAPGESLAGYVIERGIQVLEDSEVVLARAADGRLTALKIARQGSAGPMKKVMAHEAIILEKIGGEPAPALRGAGTLEDGRPYVALEWVDGDDAQTAAAKIREREDPDVAGELARLAQAILDAYAELHRRGIIHADIHPGNVLVSESGVVRIIDFGIARVAGQDIRTEARAGVPFFFEPECADAMRRETIPPPASFAGEQYGLGALIYLLLTGRQYLDFSFGREEMLRQISEDRPIPFGESGLPYSAAIQAVVLRALEKVPARRFPSTADLADAFRRAMRESNADGRSEFQEGEDARKLLDRVLCLGTTELRIPAYVGPKSPTASVTYGAAGLAYALLRIACVRDDAHLLALADGWAERAANEPADTGFYQSDIEITPDVVGRVSPFHTAGGVAAVQALIANARGDEVGTGLGVERFLQSTAGDCSSPDLTLGHASILLTVCNLMKALGPNRPQTLVNRGNAAYAEVNERLSNDPLIGEGTKGDEYLGMAHGWAGLLYAVLRWRHLLEQSPSDAEQLRLQQLAGFARFTKAGARWPVHARPGSISMAGWCNGSAGYSFLWALAHRLLGEERYLELAERAAMDAFQGSGGGHGLCCGFGGQAYAQLNLYKLTGEGRWLIQARELGKKAASFGNMMSCRKHEGLPHSLYKGDVGVAVLLADLERPETAAMPFFEE